MMSKLKKSLWTAITLFITAALFILAGVFTLTPKKTAYADAGDLYWGIDSDGVLTLSDSSSAITPTNYTELDTAWESSKGSITSVTVVGNPSAPSSMEKWFSGCTNLTTVNLSGLNTSNVTTMKQMFLECSKLESLDVSSFNTSNVTTMKQMFLECSKLESLDVSSFDTSNVTDMTNMFYGCSKLESLDISSFNTSSVTNSSKAEYMFAQCSSLKEINTPNAIGARLPLYYTFWNGENDIKWITDDETNKTIYRHNKHNYENGICTVCECEAPLYWGINSTTGVLTLSSYESTAAPNLYSTIGEAPAWYNDRSDITSVTVDTYAYAPQAMIAWFQDCENLTTVNLSDLDTSGVVMMSYAFNGCNSLTELDLSSFDTSNVENMCEMFHGCSSLEALILPSSFVNANANQINGLFYDCSSLTSLDVSSFDTSNVTLMGGVFKGCSSLTAIDVSGFVTTKATDMSQLFYGCSSLTSLNVSNFDTAKVEYTFDMFRECSGLTELNLSSFDTSKVTDMKNMFKGCSALASLNVSSFDTTNVEDTFDMFSGCDSLNEIQTPSTVGTVALPLPCNYWNSDPDRGLIDEITSADASTATEIKTIYRHADHDFAEGDDWTVGVNTHWHACSRCDAVADEADHNYENGECTVCGTAAELYWKIDSEGVLTLSSFKRDAAFEPYEDSTWASRKSEIESVTVDTYAYAPVSTSLWFDKCKSLTTADLTGLDTSRVTDMSSMFLSCEELESLNLSGFDTSNVTGMGSMFFNCYKLTSLDLSGFNTASLTSMYTMFSGCRSLTSLTFSSSFHAEKVTNMHGTFSGCWELTSLDLSSFNATSVTNMGNMFMSNMLNTITVSESLAQKLSETSENTYLYAYKNWYDGNGPVYTDSNRFSQAGTYTTVQPPFEVTVGTDITYYTTITDAWAAANNAETAATVKMYADAETAATLTVNSGKDITLDLNGCMLKRTGNDLVISVYGTFTLEDNSDKTASHTVTSPVTNESVSINGGVITGGKGSGVFVETGGTFTMTGGNISGNSTTHSGGGVHVAVGGTFIMMDGEISNNAAWTGGGVCLEGVYVGDGDGGKFTMTGGTIRKNMAEYDGGGVNIDVNAVFEAKGGTVSENTASNNGGGVYVFDGTFKISGTPNITGNEVGGSENNVCLNSGKTITVTGALESGEDKAQIGVSSTGAVIKGFTQESDPWDYFIPDNSANNCMYVSNPSNGEVFIGTHTGGTATCTQKAECLGCGEEYGEVDGNNHTWNEGTFTTQPTCTEEGEKTFTCTGCGATKTESAEAIGHDFSGDYLTDSEGHWHVCQREGCTVADTKEDHSGGTATCSAKAHCEKCGEEYGEVDSSNHAWNDGEITTDPTCTVEGEKTFTCSHNSAHTKTESVEALGHTVVTDAAVDPTCTEAGLTEGKHCSACNTVLVAQTTVDALGHDEVSHGPQAATCTEAGWNEYVTCSRCDYTTYAEISALGHALTHNPKNAATKEADGNKEYWSCDECNKYFADENGTEEITDGASVIIPKLTNKSLQWWIILIIVLGVLVIVGVVIAIVFFEKKKKDGEDKPQATEAAQNDNAESGSNEEENSDK